LDQPFEELVAKYGEDNARFLMDFQNQWVSNYTTAAYIKTELGHRPDVEAEARRAAEAHGWEFEIIEGSDRLIRALIDGDWNEEEFLIVQPGQRIAAAYDDRIVAAHSPA
jgi:hypothetical protein